MKKNQLATLFAILAAALYATSVPCSKGLLEKVSPTMMAAFLYLGAGVGLFLWGSVAWLSGKGEKQKPLTKKELPDTIAMVILDIFAPILLMLGIQSTSAANVSLINNFEIVATSLVALLVFKEVISLRLWLAIGLVTAASIILSFEGAGAFDFNAGSLFVFGACLCWGFENNCTKNLSSKDPVQIVVIKGIFSGLGSLVVALFAGEDFPALFPLLCAMLLGFVSYGLSIHFYILAQRSLGAAKTSAYYSIAPFLGAAFGILFLGERPGVRFFIALAVMLVSMVLMIRDTMNESKE